MNKRFFLTLNKIINGALVLLIVVSSLGIAPGVKAVGTSTVTIGSQVAVNGAAITVPINASNFASAVAGMDFSVQYDPALLTYTGLTQNAVAGHGTLTTNNVNPIPINWFDSAALTIDSGTLLTLNFTVISATTTNASLTFAGTKELNDSSANQLSASFVDGAISLNPAATLSSIAITNQAAKLSYTVGDALDITGLVVTRTYSDTSTKVETITTANVTGFNSSAPVTGQVLTITVGGKTTTYTINVVAPLSSAKAITTFNVTTPAATGIINESAHTIAVTVPFGSAVTALTPTIVVSTGAAVSPASGAVQDFTNPITYTVTAENSSTQTYVVTVTVAPSFAKAITAFSFSEGAGVVDESAKTIAVTVPYTTVVVALVPTIVITGASVSPASGVPQNFINPVTYTVTAVDASTQAYVVTVTVAGPSDLTALVVALNIAQSKYDAAVEGNSTGKYPAPLKANLLSAITTASAITNVSYQSAVDAAVATLNAAVVTFDAGVVPPDTTAPVITLLGQTPINLSFGGAYTDAGATALDNRDGDITANIVRVNPVNSNAVGTYTITYNVSDAEGNAAQQVTRTVHVVDTTAPVITLLGEAAITLALGNAYNEPGYTAIDNVDGDLHDQVVISSVNPVNVNVVGTYTISYRVSDAAGNTTVVQRKVKVLPVITAEQKTLVSETTLDAVQHDVVVGVNDVASAIVSVPADVTNAHLDVTTLVEQIDATTKNATIAGAITVNAETSIGAVQVQMPLAMQISASLAWTGMINAPQVQATSTVTLPSEEGQTAVPSAVVEVGAGDILLTLTKAARLTIPGQAGKRAGYERGGLFTAIGTKCSADTQVVGDALSAGSDCTIDVGSDLVIWTKHFTRFVTYQLAGRSHVIRDPSPESVSVAIAEGQTTAKPEVTLTMTYGADVIEMAFSHYGDFRGAILEAAVSTRAWVLDMSDGDGQKTVYVMFKNADGGRVTKSATITVTRQSGGAPVSGSAPVIETPATPSAPAPETPVTPPNPAPPEPRVLGVENTNVVALERQRLTFVDRRIAQAFKGKALASPESPNAFWYIDPVSLQKFHVANSASAFRMLGKFGLGISNADLAKIPVSTDPSIAITSLAKRLRGRILLQVQSRGEAWYVNPDDGKRYYVSNGAATYEFFHTHQRDIPPVDFRKIDVGDLG